VDARFTEHGCGPAADHSGSERVAMLRSLELVGSDGADSSSVQSTAARIDATRIASGFVPLAEKSARRSHAPRKEATPRLLSRRARRSKTSRGIEQAHENSDAILGEAAFMRLLQREERRSDRSRAPLSLTLFRLDADAGMPHETLERFSTCLKSETRETDYLGKLGDGIFAVLHPDTAAAGTGSFSERVQRTARGLRYTSRSATYPGDRLEELVQRNLESHTAQPKALPHGTGEYALKRTLDVVGALVALLLAAPIMAITALAVALTSPGPVIFRQVRLGKGAVPFVFYKFRSMSADVPDDIHRRYVENLIKGNDVGDAASEGKGLAYKMNADPRITPVGRWIRKTSIDELPQLWNVLRGEMSLVGPRPPIPYEAENYQPWHLRRVLEVKPGITGLWQVQGRSRVSFDDMVRMDLHYAQNCSLGVDLRILLRTVRVVLRCEGAG